MKYIEKSFMAQLRFRVLLPIIIVASLPLQAQSTKKHFKAMVFNSIGEPQKNLYLKVKGYSEKFDIDDKGVIEYEVYMSKYNVRTAQLFFKGDDTEPVKSFDLDENVLEHTFYINSSSDILRFKQENKQVEIEGILQNEAGEPVQGATVSILGTGSQATSDEIGLFHIMTDYNHPIIIRARGMETLTMKVDAFIRNADEALIVTLHDRNSDLIYNIAEVMPEYRGGMKNFVKYLNHVAAYPEEKQKSGVEGVVVIQFVVEKDGSISQTDIVRRLEPELDSLALNAIKRSPRWIPAKDAGRTVRCRYSMPVPFKIPKPVPPAPVVNNTVGMDSLKVDSLRMDSLRADSLLKDSLAMDSLRMKHLADSLKCVADSLRADSLRMDSLALDSTINKVVVDKKAKKRTCAFVRFFRRLFGIKRGEDIGVEEVSVAPVSEVDKERSKRKKGRKNKQPAENVPMPAEVTKGSESLADSLPNEVETPVGTEKEN